MSDLLLEVDEALRDKQIKALWEKFGQWIIGFAILAVIATAVGVTWHNHTNKMLSEQSTQLLSILQNEAETAQTPEQLAALSKKAKIPLRSVVDLYRAQKFEQAKNLAAAQKVYGVMVRRTRMPDVLKDLARIHYVRLGLVQNKLRGLLPVIEPLAKNDDANFHASALDMKAAILTQQNKTEQANKIYAQLAADERAPDSIRARARSMMAQESK